MAEKVLNLNNFKSSGVYTVEIDQSQGLALPLTTGRLIIGSSRKGPFNTVVLINDVRTLNAVYGDRDTQLEKQGSYFHRTIEVALREGPVFAMNVLPLDTDTDVVANLDKAYFTTYNTESSSNNEDSAPYQYPLVEFFNKRKLWFADDESLNKSKNLALGDDYILNPSSFGNASIASNKILSFANTGNTNMTVWVRKATVTGFDVTAKEWYASFGESIDFPNFVSADDFISDYFVEVIIVDGDWSNNIRLSKDALFSQFFDESGLIDSQVPSFLALQEVQAIARVTGCLIPEFKDQSGTIASVDSLVNRLFATTGLLCALDADKLDLIDLEDDNFSDINMETHRVDTIGHGYDELDSDDVYSIDNGGFEPSGTVADSTPLIDILSYSKPGDKELIYKIDLSLPENDFTGATTKTYCTCNQRRNNQESGCNNCEMNAMGYVGAIISIIAGCLGLIWPKQVSRTIGLQIPGRLGQSEVRATYGGLFIGAGLAVTLIASSDAALVLGAAWAGAFIARAISFVIDKSRTKENVAGLVIEGVMAALLILA